MDNLIQSLNEVSVLLIPIVGVVCLILLAIILFNFNKTVKRLSITIDNVHEAIASTTTKIDKLEGPLNTLNSVSKTVDVVNDSAVSAVSSVVKFSMKHSDSIVNWGKSAFGKNDKVKEDEEVEKKEEDFGIYE